MSVRDARGGDAVRPAPHVLLQRRMYAYACLMRASVRLRGSVDLQLGGMLRVADSSG